MISVETAGCGFLPDRRPKILFERHIFSRLTCGRYDATAPDVSQPTAGGYGAPGANQYDRLAVAQQLDAAAALQSASWGLGQVMGENFAAAGFADVAGMVAAMVTSEDSQLLAVAAFVANSRFTSALSQHDWQHSRQAITGPITRRTSMTRSCSISTGWTSAGPTPDLLVRAAQIYLTYRGFAPGGVDGVNGRNTAAAVRAFQASAGLDQTGVIDDALLARLSAG